MFIQKYLVKLFVILFDVCRLLVVAGLTAATSDIPLAHEVKLSHHHLALPERNASRTESIDNIARRTTNRQRHCYIHDFEVIAANDCLSLDVTATCKDVVTISPTTGVVRK